MITLMHVQAIKTRRVEAHDDLESFLEDSIVDLQERSILTVTSKVVALCEGRLVPKQTGEKDEKHELVRQQAEQYIDPSDSPLNLMLTIKTGVLAVNAGVDESNIDNRYYVLLPEDSFVSAEKIWRWARHKFGLKEFGVIVTDSRTVPLKWGVLGTALGYCGFVGLRNEIGHPDLYGRKMKMTQINNAEALAVAAVYVGGESAESQPLVVVSDLPQVVFTQSPPDAKEKSSLEIRPIDDVYWPIISSAAWKKGGAGSK